MECWLWVEMSTTLHGRRSRPWPVVCSLSFPAVGGANCQVGRSTSVGDRVDA